MMLETIESLAEGTEAGEVVWTVAPWSRSAWTSGPYRFSDHGSWWILKADIHPGPGGQEHASTSANPFCQYSSNRRARRLVRRLGQAIAHQQAMRNAL